MLCSDPSYDHYDHTPLPISDLFDDVWFATLRGEPLCRKRGVSEIRFKLYCMY
jgi:hypothetical protein